MRGVMVSVAVGLACWLALPAAAAEPEKIPLPEGAFGGEVDGGSLFYADNRRARTPLVRFDLDTRTVLWAPPDRRASIVRVEAGGGVLAVEVLRGLRRTRVLALDPAAGSPVLIGSARSFLRRGCGRDLKLEDVSEAGDIVVSESTAPCGSRRGTFVTRAFRRTGPPLILERRRERMAFISDGSPYRTLQGTQYLTWDDRIARVRDLASGEVRVVRAPGRAWFLGQADVAADGRVLLNLLRGGPGGPKQRLMLDDRVVFDSGSGNAFAEASFCGRHAVRHLVGPRREQLSLLDPPSTLRDGRPLAFDFVTTCDQHSLVVLDGKRNRALVYELPD